MIKTFIETQFPVSRISKEAYKERKAGSDQTLTSLGKWWGRKPLVLVRATILGCILPSTNNPQKDKEVFLELMGMTDKQLLLRKNKPLPKDVNFNLLSYDEKLTYCLRPEQAGDDIIDWEKVNNHLGTKSNSTTELINELSNKRYGHQLTIGDVFSGGGSHVFEAARIGAKVYGSDLNPLAGLLTWADVNLIGAQPNTVKKCNDFLNMVFNKTVSEIDALDVEQDEEGRIAKYYLYCSEVVCPECGQKVPLLPSFIISEKYKATIKLIKHASQYSFSIKMNSTDNEMKESKIGTIQKGNLCCPNCHKTTSLSTIKGGEGSLALRRWAKNDWKPTETDVLQERLYAIKCVKLEDINKKEKFRKKPGPVTDSTYGTTYYCAPTIQDIQREKKVEDFVSKNFISWQQKGYIPSNLIVSGDKTNEPIRTKGWMYWHQLFNPRQLIIIALLMKNTAEMAKTKEELISAICGINNTINRLAKLSIWNIGCDKGEQVFSNQALNTLNNWACRSTYNIFELFVFNWNNYPINSINKVCLADARDVTEICDFWITDPPYADAVNYHELSEFFLAWDASLIKKAFPEWYTDTKRALAVKGTGESFNLSMIEIYKNLACQMPSDGMQVVMFTHQDVKVWAELSMILWSAGLQVSSAWCVQTETNTGLKKGNYVQGTVLLVLRKRENKGLVFQDELYEEIREEVHLMIDSMRNIDSKDNPDFNDSDYLLAAYAASLKVLTSYNEIEGIDVQYELTKARESSKESPVTKIINRAKQEAYDYLVPSGIEARIWTSLTPEERFYIKSFELGLNGCFLSGSFQELARSFGVTEYKNMLGSSKANQVRIKTPQEYKSTLVDESPFGKSLLRHILLAIWLSLNCGNALEGRNYLKSKFDEKNKYWALRNNMIALLSYLSRAKGNAKLPMWQESSAMAELLMYAISNDSI